MNSTPSVLALASRSFVSSTSSNIHRFCIFASHILYFYYTRLRTFRIFTTHVSIQNSHVYTRFASLLQMCFWRGWTSRPASWPWPQDPSWAPPHRIFTDFVFCLTHFVFLLHTFCIFTMHVYTLFVVFLQAYFYCTRSFQANKLHAQVLGLGLQLLRELRLIRGVFLLRTFRVFTIHVPYFYYTRFVSLIHMYFCYTSFFWMNLTPSFLALASSPFVSCTCTGKAMQFRPCFCACGVSRWGLASSSFVSSTWPGA